MDSGSEIAPAVRSILQSAQERGDPSIPQISVSPRSLIRAIDSAERDGLVPVIAEVKPTSPTTSGTRREDPVELATAMVAGGAMALSVLTEPDHFGGSTESLERVRAAVDVPVLRKDFILHEHQLDLVEADIILLIARFLDDVSGLLDAARERGFQVLVEVHTAAELAEAVDAGADIIGINNRDLTSLTVDLRTFETVAPAAPPSVTLIAESGIQSQGDVDRMRHAGADALLIGTAIMNGDVEANTRRMTGGIYD